MSGDMSAHISQVTSRKRVMGVECLQSGLVEEGLLIQQGERKSAHYVRGAGLTPKQ